MTPKTLVEELAALIFKWVEIDENDPLYPVFLNRESVELSALKIAEFIERVRPGRTLNTYECCNSCGRRLEDARRAAQNGTCNSDCPLRQT